MLLSRSRARDGNPYSLATRPVAVPIAQAGTGSVRLLVFGLLLAVSLLPVLLTPIPAMVDYLNHLARMHILVRDGTPGAHPHYRVAWAFYPNLAMDLLVPQLARFMSVELAARVFLLASQILIATGSVAIELAVKRRFEISGFVAVLMLYSLPFAWGFTNFEFGLGLALWGIAGWLVLEERPWIARLGLHALFVALLFAAHLFALGIYGFTLGLHELWRARARGASVSETFMRLLTLALPPLALLGIMIVSEGAVGQAGTEWFLQLKPLWIFAILNGYSVVLSAASTVILLIMLYALAKHRALRFEASGGWLLAGLALLYLVMPSKLLDTAFVDLRIIVAAILIIPGFLTLSLPNRYWRFGVASVAVGITLANVGLVAVVWASYSADYSAMIASFGRLEKGSRVLVGHRGDAQDPPLRDLTEYPIYHAPTLAVHYADAFVPTLFTSIGKQPLAVREIHRHLAVPYGGPAPIAVLRAIAQDRIPPGTPSFVQAWPRDFDYLYVVGAPAPNPIPDIIEEMEAESRFTLYRIRKPAGPS